MMDKPGLSEDQQEIRRLKKALKNAELERDILKKAQASSPREMGDIQIYSPEQGNLPCWEDVGNIWHQQQFLLQMGKRSNRILATPEFRIVGAAQGGTFDEQGSLWQSTHRQTDAEKWDKEHYEA